VLGICFFIQAGEYTGEPVWEREKGVDTFFTDIEIPLLHPDELYGSKLVAAMDRQHPRDIFDILKLYEEGGLTEGMIECFVCYLAGHNRPIHEVLFANEIDMTSSHANEFVGMTKVPVPLEILLKTRRRLFAEIRSMLSGNQRSFLISLAEAQHDILLGKLSANGVIFPADVETPFVGAGLIKIPVTGKADSFRTGAVILER
jgi:hypothetical protein